MANTQSSRSRMADNQRPVQQKMASLSMVASDVGGIVAATTTVVHNIHSIQERLREIRVRLFGEYPMAISDTEKAPYNPDGLMGDIFNNASAANSMAQEVFDHLSYLEMKLGIDNGPGNTAANG